MNPSAPLSAPRRTLARPAVIRGVTLFTGVQAGVVINPLAGPHPRIEFRRLDLPGSSLIRATASHVVPESRRTVLSADPKTPGAPTVQTVEHILSALAGLGVTDALVDVEGPEIPIGDGSAKPFADAILAAGVAPLGAEVLRRAESESPPPLVLREKIVVADEKSGARIEALPHDSPGLELVYVLEYPPGAPIPAQQASLFVPFGDAVHGYEHDVAPARTFSLLQEAEAARKMGLFAHLTTKEMLVIGPGGPIDNSYRFDNEPARHKLLDLLGDLSLCGRLASGIQARVVATRAGHAMNHRLAAALEMLK